MRKKVEAGFDFHNLIIFTVIVLGLTFTSAWAQQPEVTFHGQFRVNYYADSRTNVDDYGDGDVAAHRLRFRPTWDAAFDDGVKLHVQFNIGHIKEGFGNHQYNNGGDPSFGLRHGYILAPIGEHYTAIAGIVPVSDKFGDTLFSGDWDFNPVTLAFLGKSGNLDWRIGIAKLMENDEANKSAGADDKDDFNAYVIDVDSGAFGGSVYHLTTEKQYPTAALAEATLTIYGVRWAGEFGSTKLNAFVMGSSLDAKTANHKSNGFAGKVEGKLPMGDKTVGLLGIFATGDKDYGTAGKTAKAFITPMSLIGHHGYYGYTGKLNIQGPTDTGIDDPVNIDGGSYGNGNLGRGLMTLQANLSIPGSNKLSYYVAAGWFQSVACQR